MLGELALIFLLTSILRTTLNDSLLQYDASIAVIGPVFRGF